MRAKESSQTDDRRIQCAIRLNELLPLFHDRDFEADNFELGAEIVSLCNELGCDVPADLS